MLVAIYKCTKCTGISLQAGQRFTPDKLENHHFTQLKFLTILSIIYIEPLIIQVDFKYLTTYVQKLQTWLLGDHTINYLTILIEDGGCSKGRFKKYLL